ncbi:fused MFS/spermidine synthase [Myxococcota bacterium]
MNKSTAFVAGGLGCFATASQVGLVREFLVVFAGNELCLGVIFACWFLGIVIGADAGGRLAQRAGYGPARLWICSGLMVALLPLLFILLRAWRGILSIPPGELPALGDLLISGLVLITPFCLLIGLSFPLMCRFAAQEDQKTIIGRVYVIESLGAVVGGLCIGVLLAGWTVPFESMVITALPLLLGLAWSAFYRFRIIPGCLFAGIGLAALVLLIMGGVSALDGLTAGKRFDDLQTGAERVAWADTPYQHLDLAKRGEQVSLFADGKVTATLPDPYRSRPRAHLVLTEHPGPKRVLVLGAASVEFLVAALRHPLERIDLVELDPGVIDLIRPHLDQETVQALENEKVRLHQTDGRRFLSETTETWDLIFSDAPDPATAALNRFFTREFFQLARSRLAPGGIFVTRISSSANFLGLQTASMIRTVQFTLQQAYAHTKTLPGGETFFLASDAGGILLDDPKKLGDRYDERGVSDHKFSRHHFAVLFQAELVEDLQDQLDKKGRAQLNTDARPVTYLQSVLRWTHMTRGGAGGPLAFLASLPAWAWFMLVVLLSGGTFLLLRRRDEYRRAYLGAVTAIGVVGGAGLALELVLTFSYQSLFGSLYRELGLIVAAFMGGLVLGGVWINRRLEKRPGTSGFLGVVLLVLAVFSAALPWIQLPASLGILPLWAGQILLLLLVLAAGVGTGVVFPLSSHIAVLSGRSLARTAGSLDAVDHLGAALGAFLTGVILVPVLGRTTTCLLLALACALIGAINLFFRNGKD